MRPREKKLSYCSQCIYDADDDQQYDIVKGERPSFGTTITREKTTDAIKNEDIELGHVKFQRIFE